MVAKMTAALLLAAFVGAAVAAVDYKPIDSTTSKPLELSKTAIDNFVTNINALPELGPEVTGAHFSKYADPEWDSEFAGTPTFWMGVASGGCGYGNLLDSEKYPYLMGLSLSTGTRKALGWTTEKQGVGCGACIKVTCVDEYYCPKGATSAVGVVLDVCPDIPGHESGKQCAELHADMYMKGWEQATGNSPSNPKVILQRVMCPDPKTNIQLMVMFNKGPYQFLKVHFQNVAGLGIVTGAQYECKNSETDTPSKVTMENTYGAVWQVNNAPLKSANCRFILSQEDGSTVTTNWLGTLSKGQVEDYPFVQIKDTGVQFKSSNATQALMTGVTAALANSSAPLTLPAAAANATAAVGVAGRKLL
jgi:hypothetical protein